MAKKAEAKTKPTTITAEEFITTLESEAQQADSLTALQMMKKVTGKDAVMWGPAIIGFGSYHYKYESGHEGDAPLAAFSPRKGKMTFYMMAGLPEIEPLLEKLGKHKTSKGCLYITKLSDVDLKVLSQIMKASYQYVKKKYPSK